MRDIVDCISEVRLSRLIAELATFGARADGGVNRQALTECDIAARAYLARHAGTLNCTTRFDAAGNVFFRREGSAEGPPVATGSHIDTQPAGGKLDGAYGVCAGLEVVAALNDAGIVTREPMEVIVWANEEGCRFAPGSLGAQAFVNPARLQALIASKDAEGVVYGDCVDAMRKALAGYAERPVGGALRMFVEAHIEQGPVLEHAGTPIGVVSGVQAVRWFRVNALGEAGHAGTTPLAHRRDALRALAPLMEALYRHADGLPNLRLTLGKIDVIASSINTIPGDAHLTVDMRHTDARELDRCEKIIDEYCASPRFGCELTVERLMALPTTAFDDAVRSSLRASAKSLRLDVLDMVSGAFHDSVHLAGHCPTGMIFVPSHRGLSHHPGEFTDPRMLTDGVRVLARALLSHAEAIST
jgi:N-carbamoyl-L-amino-acid hydrolase